MTDYVLMFDAAHANPQQVAVPANKRLYLTRASQVSAGTATVLDVAANTQYVIPDGTTVLEVANAPAQLSLAFTERSNDKITFVMATVKTPTD